VDLDEDVIKTCEQFFPQWGDAWKDPRASLHICDGAQFVRDTADGSYDVIIQDSSDPFVVGDDGVMKPLPSEALYEKNHICHLHRILKPNGILNIQVRGFNVFASTIFACLNPSNSFVVVCIGRIYQCSNIARRNHNLETKHGSLWLQEDEVWQHRDHFLSNWANWIVDGRKGTVCGSRL
jgi:hypothetical protein